MDEAGFGLIGFGAVGAALSAADWARIHPASCRRKHAEVLQVMRELGAEPLLTEGTERVFRRSCSLQPWEAFPGAAAGIDEAIAHLADRVGKADRV